MKQISEEQSAHFLAQGEKRAELGDKELLKQAQARLAELEDIQAERNKLLTEKTSKSPQNKNYSGYINIFGLSTAERKAKKEEARIAYAAARSLTGTGEKLDSPSKP